ncbi:LytR/AlgR family response regulator transcription factor [Candidatus Galacturonibacter soehngenii]|uniref:Stage 0 sporulation protein A homolog n=1 Tax=Candidatus Galacturonatibacter soehngenii TaxID=2307010 RepID=A0A7V7QKJ3_9FIRM|nr:LytTR family DNA-binding domain-containing protein [Candidatus Galacturonibacter soehngenii]KAB1438342.1 response regulator transcription factor [Candidatus Galacturonibacter soehngenii]
MIKIAVCYDEYTTVNQIEKFLLELSEAMYIPMEIDIFYSGKSLEKAILKKEQYDLLYLDVYMKGEAGITLARNIRKIDEYLLIIYVSSYMRHLIKLFRLDIFDFIKKPINFDDFSKIFLLAYQKISNKKIYFTFQYKNEKYKVLCSEIMYFESRGRQIRAYMKNGEVEIFNEKLNVVEQRLQTGKIPFLRIHQSYLVNYHWIKSCSKTKVTIINGLQLPISEERRKCFGESYRRLIKDEIDG